jgi:hypothetical protein
MDGIGKKQVGDFVSSSKNTPKKTPSTTNASEKIARKKGSLVMESFFIDSTY